MIERRFEQIIFASRWLLAPFYLGLVVSLVLLLAKFTQEIFPHRPACAGDAGKACFWPC